MRKTSKRSGFAHLLSQICVLLVMLCAPLAGRGQSSSDALPQPPDIKTTSNLVIVPARVSSASKVQILDLHASDFLVTDNGIPQTVRIEDAEHQPISLLVLIQTGGA